MDKREQVITGAVVLALLGIAWLVSCGGIAKVSAQAEVAGAGADDGPVSFGTQLNTGIVPDKWQAHTPRYAHMGRHRMYRHPGSCSPNLTAPHQLAYDWLWCPPSEGDL